MSVCICTSSDHIFIKDLFILLYSLKKIKCNIPIYIYDVGLENAEKENIYKTGIVKEIISVDFFKYGIKESWDDKVFIKPFLISNLIQKTKENVLWIDSDIMVMDYGRVNFLFKIIEKQTIFTQSVENMKKIEKLMNKSKLYEMFPTKYRYFNRSINSGVIGINKKDSESVLKDWCFMVENAFKDRTIRKLLGVWGDQGCLVWALENYSEKEYAITGSQFNWCPLKKYRKHCKNFSSITEMWNFMSSGKISSNTIFHFKGQPKLGEIVEFSYLDILKDIQNL